MEALFYLAPNRTVTAIMEVVGPMEMGLLDIDYLEP